jgi:hypothetical protein
MRDAIRRQLLDKIPEINDRCLEPHAADKDTKKPYIVVRFGAENEDTPWTGFRRIIEIWPNNSWTKFKSIDNLSEKIKAALHNQLLTTESGEVFTCVYIGVVGNDAIDQDWDIITRGIRFAILALQPVGVVETLPNDPWLESLSAWTKSLLGDDWHIYQNVWPVGYRRPSVLWRVSNVKVISRSAAFFEVQKQIIGHVQGLTPNEQYAVTLQIVQELGSAVKIIHDGVNKRYLTISNPSADFKAMDVLKNGQISLALSSLTNKPVEDTSPLINNINIKGEVN